MYSPAVGLALLVEVAVGVELLAWPCDDLKAATAARVAPIEVTASRVVMVGGSSVQALPSLATLPLSSSLSDATRRCTTTNTEPFNALLRRVHQQRVHA